MQPNLSNSSKKGAAPHLGFTLVELMVVVAVIGILASILLPVLSKSKEKGRQTSCLNSIRQIGIGFSLYLGDFQDTFPGPGSKQRYGPQPEDWIWWQYGRNITNSSLARYVSGFNTRIFTCPTDREAFELQAQGPLPDDPYRYSYSFTSYDLEGEWNPGMATIITLDHKAYPFRSSMILNPSAKIMLAEEQRDTINDPRFVPKDDTLSNRHRGRCNVVFADGHAQSVEPNITEDASNVYPTK